MSPSTVFVAVAVVLQVVVASPFKHLQNPQVFPGHVNAVAPVVAPCNAPIYPARAPLVSAPTQVISPKPRCSAPAPIISAPAPIISAPAPIISAPAPVISVPQQFLSPVAPCLQNIIVERSVANTLADTLSLLVVSDLIQSSLAPTLALTGCNDLVAAAPVRPALNLVESIQAPLYNGYETVTPVVKEAITSYSPYGATTSFVDIAAGPSYVEYAGYAPNFVETLSYGGLTETIVAPGVQYANYLEPALSGYVSAPCCC